MGWPVPPPSLYPFIFFQTIMNKLWLGFDLTEAIAAPILHVNSQGHVEYEPQFNQVRLRFPPAS